MLLENKVGVITGAGNGMGRASAVRCAKEGAKLALFDVTDLSDTVRLINEAVPEAETLCLNVDVTDEEAVANAMEKTVAAFGKLNFAFNNAGIMIGGTPVGELDAKSWERVLHVNLFGSFYCAKHEIRQMLKNPEPSSIIFNSSVGGLIGTPTAAGYVASKHAVIGLMKCIMCEYSDKGVRSNAVCPGQIDTPMWEGIHKSSLSDPEAYAKINRSQNPMRRLGLPEEVAATVAFLASDESSHITGVALPIDGGHVATNATYFNWD